MNVSTRVGFQCVSDDTEVLTPTGWASYDSLKIGDEIKTFNHKTHTIENLPIKKMFQRKYKGKMYNLTNRIQDQLISPNHRIVRKLFNTNSYKIETIEDVLKHKTLPIIPITGKNINNKNSLSDDEIKLLAWIITEGTSEHPGQKYRQSGRITIYQSKIKNPKNYKEIITLLKKFKLNYTERNSTPALGKSTKMIRLNADSSHKLHTYFDDVYNIKHIPNILFSLNKKQARLFIDTYIKGDGSGNRIATIDKNIIDGLQHLCLLAEYGTNISIRKPILGTKDIYMLRIIKNKDTQITNIKEINYDGIIWCPNTDNGTFIARRNGTVFITGNCPFSNITLDVIVPNKLKVLPVTLGGELMDFTYADCQPEMDLFNDVFCELMIAGDFQGRLFSFPIPTYNIHDNFDWNNPRHDKMWEMTAKYGIPYFANYVNSDMDPDQATSMCCRLRIDHTNLSHRGGGLFGSSPNTGSIGVVTINLPRIGYLSKTKEEFYKNLDKLMDSAKDSLIIKTELIEKLTDDGLYPYTKVFLDSIKNTTGKYWSNHFLTIGLLGMNEASINFGRGNIITPEGNKFAQDVLEHMRNKIIRYQEDTGYLFNLEATPGEGTTRRFANIDKKKFENIIVANNENVKTGATPYYTNSTQLPVDSDIDLFKSLELQEPLQTKYTGGTVFHIFLGEKAPSPEAVKKLIKRCCENYKIPYFSITPTFSICPKCGYLEGEYRTCPRCFNPITDEVIEKGL